MSQNSLNGKQFDEYKLEKLLGEGGMASVYRALDIGLNRYAAVKVILPNFRADSDYQMRFSREAQAIAQLEHQHIVTIYRYGNVDNMLYMAMQFVDGMDLAGIIEDCREDGVFIDNEEIIKLTHQIGSALDYAHNKGVIHRDVKPHNILINQDGNAIVSDFGLALLTEVGTYGEIFGSPHYIAPEQAISSAGVVPQSDLYALGVILFEILTGELPFDADEPLDIAMKHMSESVPSPRSIRPDLSQAIEDVLFKALEKKPENRYATGQELANAVEKALKAKPAAATTLKNRPMPTIANRIELNLENNPLPPLPAPVVQDTAEHQSAPTQETPVSAPQTPPPPQRKAPPKQKPKSEQKSGIPIIPIAIGVIIVLAMMGAFLIFGSSGDELPEIIPSNTSDLILNTQTETLVPTHTPPIIATMTNAPAEATPIPPSVAPVIADNWTLDIRWVSDDSLFIENTSASDFPINSLELNGTGSVNGTEWGLSTLSSSQCVAVFKDSGNPQTANDSCTLVGNTITRSGGQRFWEASFAVQFNGARIRVCEASPCTVEIRQ